MNNNDIYNDYDDEQYTPRRRRSRQTEGRRQMSVDNAPKNKKRRKTPLQKFLTIVISVAAVYFVALGIFAAVAYFSNDPNDSAFDVLSDVVGIKLKERTNFLIMCTDEDGTRTDTIMLGCYNSTLNRVDLISIPRDTMVSVSAATYEKMQQEYPYPDSNEMQINHIHHFVGEEDGPQALNDEIEAWLGIDIDYYARVSFDAFKYFVDSVGGVEFNVPRDMNYDDPTQDLAIHLEAGTQVLDGDKAEQLVRYRKDNYGGGYTNGDLGRIEVQQAFLKALIKKAVSADTITSSPKAYLTTFFKYVTTNASITDAVKYVSALSEFDSNNIYTYTLPGEARNRYYCDEAETRELIYNIFERPSEEILAEQNGEVQISDSKSASIQVLNGGYTNGMASEVAERLQNDGYTVDDVGTYTDEKTEQTRIYVNKTGLGEDLTTYFNSAEVINDSSFTGDYDIVIIVGTNEG